MQNGWHGAQHLFHTTAIKPTLRIQKLGVSLSLLPEKYSAAFCEHKARSGYKAQLSFAFPAKQRSRWWCNSGVRPGRSVKARFWKLNSQPANFAEVCKRCVRQILADYNKLGARLPVKLAFNPLTLNPGESYPPCSHCIGLRCLNTFTELTLPLLSSTFVRFFYLSSNLIWCFLKTENDITVSNQDLLAKHDCW